jgi:hypothetical protein
LLSVPSPDPAAVVGGADGLHVRGGSETALVTPEAPEVEVGRDDRALTEEDVEDRDIPGLETSARPAFEPELDVEEAVAIGFKRVEVGSDGPGHGTGNLLDIEIPGVESGIEVEVPLGNELGFDEESLEGKPDLTRTVLIVEGCPEPGGGPFGGVAAEDQIEIEAQSGPVRGGAQGGYPGYHGKPPRQDDCGFRLMLWGLCTTVAHKSLSWSATNLATFVPRGKGS